jgi:hypothetical protein
MHLYPRLSTNSRTLTGVCIGVIIHQQIVPLHIIRIQECLILALTRPVTIIARVSFASLFLDAEYACGFLKNISIIPACYMAPRWL